MRVPLRVALLASCALPRTAAAVRPLAYDLRLEVPLTVAAGVGWILTEAAFKSSLAPSACRLCDTDSSGSDTLNGLDAGGRGLRWPTPKTADTLSNVDAFLLMPLALLGLDAWAAHRDGAIEAWPVDALVLVETVAVQAALNQLVKFVVGRERPFVHALPAGEKGTTQQPSDNNLSFYSGHSSLAFSLAVASGMVARQRGYRMAPVIWAVALPLAASVAYLRMAADKHYLSDVLVGAAVGAALGFAVPHFLHEPIEAGPIGVSLGAGPGGFVAIMRVR